MQTKSFYDEFSVTLNTILSNSDAELFAKTTKDNVFQQAQPINRPHFKNIMEELLLPDSGIQGLGNFEELIGLADQGKSCLILCAHYSNFDVPVLYTLLHNQENPKFAEYFDKLIFIAGRKLTEGDKFVKALAEMFSRLVISAKLTDMSRTEILEALAINKASQRAMTELKTRGNVFVIYPTGTRLRKNNKDSYRGLREIYNYVRKFEYFICAGISGNILPTLDNHPMVEEITAKDKVTYNFGKLQKTSEYIDNILLPQKKNKDFDKKQCVIDQVVDDIYKLGDDPRIDMEKLYHFR